MSRGTQSWKPMGFVVYGAEPLVPARIEQQIANAMPNQEVSIESFEEYEEALDHCKKMANIGVIFLHEKCGEHKIETVFKQLAKPYQASGWPVIGAVIRKSAGLDSISALKAIRSIPSIIGYYSEDDFNDPTRILEMFSELWDSYIEMVRQELIPSALEESFSALLDTTNSSEDKVFYDRISELLSQPLNLSWMERFQVRWHYLFNSDEKINPAVISPHKALKKIVLDNNDDLNSAMSLMEIMNSKTSLAVRTITTTKKIVDAARNGTIENLLLEARTEARPGRPGLLRHLAAQSETILTIHQDTYHHGQQRKTA